VWGPLPDPALRVRTHIANLRAKLARDLIRTEVGVG
jgi:DNA-binding response OmpR family regulator